MMAHLSPAQFDRLERAITDGRRIALTRHGRETVVLPVRLFTRSGREMIEARHPTTGDAVIYALDDLEHLEVVEW